MHQHFFMLSTLCLLSIAALGCDDKPIGPDNPHNGNTTGVLPTDYPTLCDVSEQVFNACTTCHAAGATAPELTQVGLANAIDTESGTYAGETWIIPNDPDASLIYKKIAWSAEQLTADNLRGVMPPTGALSSDAVTLVKQWIDTGAPTDCSSGDSDGNNSDGGTGNIDDGGTGNIDDGGTGSIDGGGTGSIDDGGTSNSDDGGTSGIDNSSSDGGLVSTVDFCELWDDAIVGSCTDCHNASSTPTSNFPTSLTLPEALTSLVGIESQTYPGHTLVIPFNAEDSLLYRKISDSSEALAGDSLGDGMPMYGGTPLTTAQISDLETWINEGAIQPASCD
jgi:hypothetical protein